MAKQALAESTASGPVLLAAMSALSDRAHDVITRLRATVFAPGEQKIGDLRFTVTKAAEMVGRTTEAIRQAEADGRLPAPRLSATGRREGYSLSEVNHMRDVFGTRPRRGPDDPPIVLAVQNFKGGVGKSNISVNLAIALSELGQEPGRVCPPVSRRVGIGKQIVQTTQLGRR